MLMGKTSQSSRLPTGLTPLRELVDGYDGLLCDIWGVVHNGVAAFDDAVDALCRFRAGGRLVILITNAPRLSKDIYPQLARLGVPRNAFDRVITSGDVTAALVSKQPDAPLFHFGPARDRSVLEGLVNPISDLPDARICLLTGPLDDAIETVDVYRDILADMRDNAVKMICANPDLVVHSGNRTVFCAGSIARLYADMGGAVVFAGKPDAAIYVEALRQAADTTGRNIAKGKLLAVGDGLPTDVKGAADNGFDACFITEGIHTNMFGKMSAQFNAAKAGAAIKGMYPHLDLVGICDSLRWV